MRRGEQAQYVEVVNAEVVDVSATPSVTTTTPAAPVLALPAPAIEPHRRVQRLLGEWHANAQRAWQRAPPVRPLPRRSLAPAVPWVGARVSCTRARAGGRHAKASSRCITSSCRDPPAWHGAVYSPPVLTSRSNPLAQTPSTSVSLSSALASASPHPARCACRQSAWWPQALPRWCA
jgi:hypothetical protein